MPLKPAILEWGTGVDVHGQNYTEADCGIIAELLESAQ